MNESIQSSFPTPPYHKSSLELSWELQDFTESGSLDIQPPADTFYVPSNIPVWVLNNVWPPISLRKLAFNRLYSSGYLSYLNLLQELLREHADQILSHPSEGPITISARGSCSPEGSSTLSIGTSVYWPSSGHPHNTHHCQSSTGPPIGSTFQG
jgi:hypothetical protein